jgi:hypothetical protein
LTNGVTLPGPKATVAVSIEQKLSNKRAIRKNP